ncbi:MAG TPA: DUF2207 domain-containing protein [Acidimicrobiia bacterium]|nr:DUF2207 domain-containing protein [Acidimicrobiia bacterium]
MVGAHLGRSLRTLRRIRRDHRARRAAALLGVIAVANLALAMTAAPPASAAFGFEGIRHYGVDLTARPDGTLAVVETIVYDFGTPTVPKHGIIRQIPDRKRWDAHHDRRYPITVTEVTASGGASAKRSVSVHGAELDIKIGDKNKTVSGVHTYVIRYTVAGAFDRFADHDELFWNAIGNAWDVSIDDVVVRLHAPAPIGRVACLEGFVNSQLACTRARVLESGTDAVFNHADLGSNEGVSIVAAMPRGTFASVGPILGKHWTFDQGFALNRETVGVAGGVAVVLVGVTLILVWMVGRDRRFIGGATDVVFGNPTGADQRVGVFDDHTTPVEYTPPDDLRPGQVGTLVDEVAGPLDVSATIIDLAVRKYLTIEEIPKQHWWGHVDWKITRLDKNDPLLAYERMLLDALCAGPGVSVQLSELKNHFHTKLVNVESALYDDAVRQGWFLRRPDRARQFWHGMGTLAILAGVGLTILLAWRTTFGLLGLAFVLAGFVLSTCAHLMPRRTPKGTGITHRVLGFRRFIVESEKDRAKFAEQANLFSEYLPYAIVFGVVEKWARTFEGLANQPDTGWYVSSHPFNAILFSQSVNSFATSSVGTLQSMPAGSGGSGFSGGGVGGGGGGGGGGSW